MMLPSVCAARFLGCTAMPASMRAPDIVHLDLAACAVDRHFGDSRRQRVVLHHGGDAERRPSRLRCQSDISCDHAKEMLHARLAFCELDPERDRVLAELLARSRPENIRRRTRCGRCRRPARARAGCRRARSRARQACSGSDIARSASPSSRCGRPAAACRPPWRRYRPRPIPTRCGGARRSSCRWRRSRPRCDARSSAGICRRRCRPRGSRPA